MVHVSYTEMSSTTAPINVVYVDTDFKNTAFGLMSALLVIT